MKSNTSYGYLSGVIKSMVLVLFISSCSKSETPENPFSLKYPDYFPEPTYTLHNNPISQKGFELGRKLFFDPMLSRDGSIACSNCHVQAVAFSDAAHAISIGIEERIGIRNAPGLFNLAFRNEFLWDGGVTHLDFVPINAIQNPVEMDEDFAHLIGRLNEHPTYPQLFEEAFGADTINGPFFLHALAQFQLMMISANSTYDQFLHGETSLSSLELDGMLLFDQHCSSCHSGPLFSDQQFRNNGLNSSFDSDPGRALISAYDGDRGKFLVPSLRNVGVTAPYMHIARFSTLEQVLEHYNSGVVDSETLDPLLRGPEGQLGIPLTEDEQKAIIAFLQTLTDREFLGNPLFFRP